MTAVREHLGQPVTARSNSGIEELADEVAQRLADLLADRLPAWFAGAVPARQEPLVDAAEVARILGKARSWVYDHAGEPGAVRLGSGPRPRLGFSSNAGGRAARGGRTTGEHAACGISSTETQDAASRPNRIGRAAADCAIA